MIHSEGTMMFGLSSDKKLIKLSNTRLWWKEGKKFGHIFDKKFKENKIFDFCESQKYTFINEDVIPFITSNSKIGTGHAYWDLFSIIFEYLNNFKKYKNFKILIYEDSQKGILDIIEHLCKIKVLDRNKIIYLKHSYLYKFNSIYFIKNIYNLVSQGRLTKLYYHNLSEFKQKYLFEKVNYLNPSKFYIENILLVKGCKLSDISSDRPNPGKIFNEAYYDEDEINEFCKKYNYIYLKPQDINEIVLMNILNNCKKIVFSMGTCFYKNFPFLSEKCERVDIIGKPGKYNKKIRSLLKKKQWLLDILPTKNYYIYRCVKSILDFEFKN